MRIVSADSSAALLNERFEPSSIVACASVLVFSPYREPRACLAEPIFANAENGYEVIVHEAELCMDLLETVEADVVHLDLSLSSISVEELSPIQFSSIKLSQKTKRNLLKILPKLRKIAGEIRRRHGLTVLAIGKESVPVRIAELTAGAHAILYACEKAVKEGEPVMLGLPSKCQPRLTRKSVYIYSLMAAEHDLRGYAEDSEGILKRVNIVEMLNPSARGFRALKLLPKSPNT